ncbi:MAG: IclR family transcriptional regulator [Syntrophomonas sp.]|nr:IclR family transcriptional regulator [Syntrophomonas sp.]
MEQVRTVEKALIVLAALKKNVQGLSELSRNTGLSKATLLRILNTLIKYGFVSFSQTKKYNLGISLLQLGATVSDRLELKRVASPYLEHVWQVSKETVYLSLRQGNERLCIDCLNGNKNVRVIAYAGQIAPLHVGGAGKAILAFLDQGELDDYLQNVRLEKIGPGTIININKLKKDLEKVTGCGFATSYEERVPDSMEVSAPIRDIAGKALASISVTAPISRTKEQCDQYILLVTEVAKNISKELGYSPQYFANKLI